MVVDYEFDQSVGIILLLLPLPNGDRLDGKASSVFPSLPIVRLGLKTKGPVVGLDWTIKGEEAEADGDGKFECTPNGV